MISSDIPSKLEPEVYVPEFNLQGDAFPFYIKWNGRIDKIVISYSSGVAPNTINNVDAEALKLGNGHMEVSSVEINGFLSGLFIGVFDKKHNEKTETIVFELFSNQTVERSEQSIKLFRSDLKAEAVPKEIFIDNKKLQKNGTEIIIPGSKIIFKNYGLGTSLVIIDIESTGIKKALPSDYEKIELQLREDTEHEVLKVIGKYPEHEKILSNYLELLKNPLSDTFTSDEKKDIYQEVKNLVDDNEILREDLFSGIYSAITRNTSFTNILLSFVTYLNSVKPSKVLLINPFIELEVPEGNSELKLVLHLTDLSWNDYDKLQLEPIKITATKFSRFKISDLLSFSGGVLK